MTSSEIETQKIKREAQVLLEQALSAQAQLLEADVKVWAATEYDSVLTRLAEGEGLFETGNYIGSLEIYEAVVAAFKDLEASRPARLTQSLNEGQEALDAGEIERAIARFRIASALDPDNEIARKGLEQALKREDVIGHMNDGRDRRQAGDLEGARSAFGKAFELDPAYAPAAEAINEVEAVIANQQYRDAMSAGFAARHAGKFDAARKAFDAARAVRPDSREVAVALDDLETEVNESRLSNLRARAGSLTAAEEWGDAVAAYRKALTIDPNASFAVQGLPAAIKRDQIDRAFRTYIENPETLFAPEARRNAAELLAVSARIENAGSKLQAQRKETARLVEVARTPVSLTIVSDGKTEVTIYTIGSLGQFMEKTLTLPPGDYVASGIQKGCRDVRREFSVRPGDEALRLEIKCEERV